MEKFGVQIALEEVARAKAVWRIAGREFRASTIQLMNLLVHEGARNFMSRNEMARHAGMSPRQIGDIMRSNRLNPKDGKRALSAQAAKALRENAELMGIKPHEMDLTSPLAYLPMGDDLRRSLQEKQVSQVHVLDEAGEPLPVIRHEFPETDEHYGWCKGTCGGSCGRSHSNLERHLYEAIVGRYEGMGEAWTTDDSGDTLARAAAEEAVRVIKGPLL